VTIRAVVVDIGGVLERVDDGEPELLLARWEQRMTRPAGEVLAALAEHAPGDTIGTGHVTEQRLRSILATALGLDDGEADELMAEMWDAYCGELDVEMRDFVASLRPRLKTAILSNSADGARREEQRRYDFAGLVDELVYSHEVGMQKPDPAIFRLTEQRLGVQPDEVVFVDDVEANVIAARELGWHAVLHRGDTRRTIDEVNSLLAPR